MQATVDNEMLLERSAALPGLGEPLMAYYRAFWEQAHLPPRTLALVALRVAQLHRVPAAPAPPVRPDAAKAAALEHWHRDAQFDAAERACLDFAEVYAQDCRALSDEQAEAVKAHYGDAGLVTLVQALGIFDSLTRLNMIWQAEENNGQ